MTQPYFETISQTFENLASPFDVEQRLELIRRLLDGLSLPQGGRAIEIGCGYGAITRELMLYEFSNLTVVDIAPSLVSRVSRSFDVCGVIGDALSLPIQSGTVDFVISSEVIEHCANPRIALSEFARILKPGGLLCLTTPNRRWRWLLRLGQIVSLRKFQDVEIFLFPNELISILESSGLVLEKADGCHLLPWQIPLGKLFTKLTSRYGPLLYRIQINVGVLFSKPI